MAPRGPTRPSFYLAVALSLLPAVYPFAFSYSAPTQCGQLSVAWTGGTPPYSLLITPTFSVPYNISIPDSAYSNGKGNFSTTLGVASQKQFLLTMSDSTGFGTGGTSGLLTTADPLSGAPSCQTTRDQVAWDFQLNTALQQCRTFTFEFNSSAVQPVTIFGLIPLGTPFVLRPPAGPTYDWTANLKAGTSVVWTMVDSQGRTGGSSDVVTTTNSDDASCINASSPASTVTGAPTQTGGPTTSPSPGSSSSSGAIIGGAIAGGIVTLVIVGSLVWFFCLRKRHNQKDTPHISTRFSRRMDREQLDLDPHEPHSAIEAPGSHYEAEPYMLPGPITASSTTPRSDTSYPPGHPGAGWVSPGGTVHDDVSYTAGPSSTARTSKYSEAFRNPPPNTPARFVLHTDAGEAPVDEPEVVELPPQYDSLGGQLPRRAPTYRERSGGDRPGASGASGSGAGSSSTGASAPQPPSGPSS